MQTATNASSALMAGRRLQRRKMDLFNAFHRVRRFANSIDLSEARKHALSWIELLDKLDAVTTLEERFELCGTNTADRPEMISLAKQHGACLTMHAILSVCKGGHTATYRTRDGYGYDGEHFGVLLSRCTALYHKHRDPLKQFSGVGDGEHKPVALNEFAAQFSDLIEKRRHLVLLSCGNCEQAFKSGFPNVAAMYCAVAELHERVREIFDEASVDGSLAAMDAAMTKAKPFCDEVAMQEREIIAILQKGTEDAPPRTLH